MRTICEVCKDKDTCSYIKNGKEGDCIDVQTSDYGYEEGYKDGFMEGQQISMEEGYNHAVEKACRWLEDEINGSNIEGCRDVKKLIEDFRKEMNYE